MHNPILRYVSIPKNHQQIVLNLLLAFLSIAILWKGGKSLEATWLLMLLVNLCTMSYWYSKPRSPLVPASLWIVSLLFVVVTIVSFWYSTTQNYGFDEVLRTVSLFLMFHWSFRHAENDDVWTRVRGVLLGIAVVSIGIGLAVYILQPISRFVGTFFDHRFHTDYWPNAWGQFVLLLWPLALLELTKATSRARRWLMIVLLSIFTGALALSFSRGSMIAAAGQVLFLGCVFGYHFKREFPWKEVGVSLLLVALLSFGMYRVVNEVRSQIYPIESLVEKATFQSAEGTSSASERESFWRQSMALSSLRPWTGWGPYSFRFIQPRLQTEILATSDHSHNVVLKYALERGWGAAVLFVFLILLLAVRSRHIVWDERTTEVAIVAASLLGVLAHNMIDFNLQFVAIALPFWMLLGFLAGRLPWKEVSLNKYAVRATEVGLVAIFLSLAVVDARALVLSSFGRHAEARGDTVKALQWYDASTWHILSRDVHLSRVKLFLESEDTKRAQQALDTYRKRNTEDPRAWILQGDIHRIAGNYDDAIVAYEQALETNTMNDLTPAAWITELLLSQGNYLRLKEYKEEFTELLTIYTEAIESNVHFIALSHNVEKVESMANNFANAFPDDAPRYIVLAARALHHAGVERERLSSRPPGYLW